MAVSDKYVVSFNLGGLSNRIKCLISAMRYSDRLSRKLILCWPASPSCNCHFSGLFENKISEINRKEAEDLLAAADDKYFMVTSWAMATFPEDNIPDNFTRFRSSGTGKDIDFEYDRIPLKARENILEYVNRLQPVQYIRKEIDEYSKKFRDDTVSLIIRTWKDETKSDHRNWMKLFSINNVYATIKKITASSIFVSCDSQWVIENLYNRYGEKILFYPKKRTIAGDRTSDAGIQDALIDLYLSSLNSRLIASYFSSFSEMAWWFGGCRAKVSFIPSGNLIFDKYYLKGKKDFLQLYIKNKIPLLYSGVKNAKLYFQRLIS